MTDIVNTNMAARFDRVCDEVSAILVDLLNLDESSVDRNKDFFEIGGSSILVPEVAKRISRTFKIKASSTLLYENPEVSEIAYAIIELQDASSSVPMAEEIPLRADRSRAPASFGQQQLWFLEHLAPEAGAYNVVASYRIRGAFSAEAFRWALKKVSSRHEILRTTFELDSDKVVQVVRQIEPQVIEVADDGRNWAMIEQQSPFDLAAGPLLRARIVRNGTEDYTVHLALHHIITDDWSSDRLVGEISAFYDEFTRGVVADVPVLKIQYGDFAAWQRLSFPGPGEHMAYWSAALDGAPLTLDLPTDRPRPPTQSFSGAVVRHHLEDADALARIKEVGKQHGATPFMVLLAAFGGLLSRWSDVADILIGTPIADRDDDQRKSMLGFLLNTVVLRVRTGDNPTFAELISQVKETALSAYTHQHAPFDQVVEMLAPERELSHNPVAQVMFILHAEKPKPLTMAGLTINSLEVESVTAKFDLTFSLIPQEDGLIAELEYATDLFDRDTMVSLAQAFDAILGTVLSNPKTRISDLTLPGSDAGLSFWRSQLTGDLPMLNLPTDRNRPATQSTSTAIHDFCVETDVVDDLRAFSDHEAVAIAPVITAVYQTFLARLSRAEESIVGLSVDIPATNIVCIRTSIGQEDGIRTIANRVANTTAVALTHGDVPFERVVEAVAPACGPGVPPLCQAMIVFDTSTPPSVDFDVTLLVQDGGDHLQCSLVYRTDLFENHRVAHWSEMLVTLLAGALAAPDTPVAGLPLAKPVLPAETLAPDDLRTVPELFDASVNQWPNQTACVHENQEMTYRQLNEHTQRILAAMKRASWSSGGVIGVVVDRGLDLPAALLAILRLGSAYLPIDPSQPVNRVRAMLDDAGCHRVLASRAAAMFEDRSILDLSLDLIEDEIAPVTSAITPGDPAYVVFTSGSTGRPKGVQVPHRALSAVIQNFATLLSVVPGERWLSVTRPTFDIAALELFLPLAFGGVLEIASTDAIADPSILSARLTKGDVDVVQGTPTLWRAISNSGLSKTSGLKILCGGEEMSADLAHKLRTCADRVWNVYGPTESTVWSTAAELTNAPLTIGTALPGERVYVVDDRGQPLPVGVPGELWIGGVGVADGYVNREELTIERFLVDPFKKDERVYRTGDIVEWCPDGTLRFRGRLDQQVKLRGHRIELAEIESVLRSAPGVDDAVVVLREDTARGSELVGFVLATVAEPNSVDLLGYCFDRLPMIMAPSSIHVLSALPTTASGKIDRTALMRLTVDVKIEDPTRPETSAELDVAEAFGTLLNLHEVPANTSFFALGGHSLLAAQSLNRLRSIGYSVSLQDIFRSPTVRKLADEIRKDASPFVIPRVDLTGNLPLAFVQERIWFDAQIDPDGHHYNIGGALRMRGNLVPSVLWDQLEKLVARHEPLRSRFVEIDGIPVQQIVDSVKVEPDLEDISAASDPLTTGLDRITGLIEAPFRLDAGRPFRFRLYRLATNDHILAVCLHHIVADGWSVGVLADELVRGYSAVLADHTETVEPISIRYRDYVVWERDPARRSKIDQRAVEVVARLREFPTYSSIPLDRARPKRSQHVGGTVRDRLDTKIIPKLRILAGENNATLNAVLMAGFAALLHRHGAGEKLVLACPSANRPHRALESLVGAFVNTLPIPVTCGHSMPFEELVSQVSDSILTSLRGEEVPFERIVSALEVPRSLAYPPLTQVAFVSQDAPMPAMQMANLLAEQMPIDPGIALYDLRLAVTEQDGGVSLQLDYDAEVLDEATARILLDRYVAGFTAMASQSAPGRYPFLATVEEPGRRSQNDVVPTKTVISRLREQCALQPHAAAVSCGTDLLTFAELDRRSTDLAQQLRQRHGVRPGTVVAITLPRGIAFAIASSAVLKTGAAYTAVDGNLPTTRIRFVVEDSGTSLILGDPEDTWASELPVPVISVEQNNQITGPPSDAGINNAGHKLPEPSPDDVAIIVYTSGSTGTPKGTLIPHRALIGFWSSVDYADYGPGRVFLGHSATSWDGSILEFWGAVLGGARCHFVPDGLGGPEGLAQHREEGGADTVWLTAAMFNAIVDADTEAFRGLRQVLTGGEALSPDHLRRFRIKYPDVQLVNGYGPSECTVFATCFVIPEEVPPAWASIPIGQAIGDRQVRVLDESGTPVPDLVPGELHIGGDAVALGYLGRPELTKERFIGTPPWYRTGDLVRRRTDGNLEFLGRIDDQIKLRGFRIEPGEIEHALTDTQGVRTAAVVLHSPVDAAPRLAAYVTLESDCPNDVQNWLRECLRDRLPDYMVPGSIDVLPELPLTESGKLDRRSLPAPTGQVETPAIVPSTERELALAQIIARTLGRSEIAVDDNYFDIGGDSIASIQIVSRAREVGILLSAKDFIEHQTVRALAAIASDGRQVEAGAAQELGDVPLGPIQLWLFQNDLTDTNRFTQSVLLKLDEDPGAELLSAAMTAVAACHPMLRAQFRCEDGTWRQEIIASTPIAIDREPDPRSRSDDEIDSIIDRAQAGIDIGQGQLLRAVSIATPTGCLLALVCHHLVVDGLSWRIIGADLAKAITDLKTGKQPALPAPTTSYREWVRLLSLWRTTPEAKREARFWRAQRAAVSVWSSTASQPHRKTERDFVDGDIVTRLIRDVPATDTSPAEILLAALLLAVLESAGREQLVVEVEHHGRGPLADQVNLDRTVGWFTSLYPVLLALPRDGEGAHLLKTVKNALRSVPNNGVGYGVLGRPADGAAEVRFNYLGRFDATIDEAAGLRLCDRQPDTRNSAPSDGGIPLDVTILAVGDRLEVRWDYLVSKVPLAQLVEIRRRWDELVHELVDVCLTDAGVGPVPADFPLVAIDQAGLDHLLEGLS